MVLADSSIWIDHFRSANPHFVDLLKINSVAIHPVIVGELACGNLAKRATVLKLLRSLSQVSSATEDEVILFIDRHHLSGKGLGYVDAHLLAAAAIALTPIWTFDKRLASVAAGLGLAYHPPARP